MQSEGVILFLYSEPCYVAEWFILRTSDRKSQDNWHGIANCQYPLALTISFLAGEKAARSRHNSIKECNISYHLSGC
jgi:hypothetical protein